MQRYFAGEIFSRLEEAGVLAVVVIEDPADAVPTAEALLAGGIGVMELAFRTENSLEALRRIRQNVPKMFVGAGTILRPDQLREAIGAGAQFGVSPGFSDGVMTAALEEKFPFAPGLLTPSEIERALGYGCRTVKLFPAQAAGGVSYLKAVWAPYKHLGLRFIPLGGLTADNAAEYIEHPAVLAAGGSWIAPPTLIKAQAWGKIEQNARHAASLRKAVE